MSRRTTALAWLLTMVCVVGAGAVPAQAWAQAQVSGLGPWERSQFTLGAYPLLPSSDGTTYGLVGGSLYRTDDDGMTFTKVEAAPNVEQQAVAVDRNDRNRIWVGSARGVMRSEDGGATWAPIFELSPDTDVVSENGKAEKRAFERVSTLVVSQADPHVLYMRVVAFDASLVSPNSTVTKALRLLRSRDGGATWDVLVDIPAAGCGEYGMYARPDALYPHPKDPTRVFRAESCRTSDLRERGLWVSEDQGATWMLSLDVDQGVALQLVAGGGDGPGRLYARFSRPPSDPKAEPNGALYRSDDGGKSWTALALPPGSGSGQLMGVTVKPGQVDRVFLYLHGSKPEDHRLLSSLDSGATWTSEPAERRVGVSLAPAVSATGRYLLFPGESEFWRREIQ